MLMLSILWYAVFRGLTALSPDYWSLLIFRYLTGLGLGAEWGPGSAIVAEFWLLSSRGRAGGAIHAAHGVGNLLASVVWLVQHRRRLVVRFDLDSTARRTVGRRRRTTASAMGISWLFFLRVNDWYALLATAAANGFFTGGQFSWMTIYLPELFPTRVRGSAISIVFDGSRTVAALGPLLAGWLASSFGGIGTAAAMMSLIYVVGLIVTPFAGPETKGKELLA